jgi:hypothetical protein
MFLLIFTIGLPLFSVVSATTYVSSISNGYDTWTVTKSPYSLTSNIIVNPGEVLTIEPGVVVHLNGYQIQVSGLLNAQGTRSDKIFFLSDDLVGSLLVFRASSDPACTVNYGVFYSVSLSITGGSPKLSNNYFTGTPYDAVITITSGGEASLTDNVISTKNAQDGIRINDGYVTITGNTISGAGAQQGCGIYNAGSTAPITANIITNFYTGIYTTKACTIKQNIITNNVNDGIVIQGTSADVIISANAIAYNFCGISRDANIQNNTISHNTYGLWGQTDRSTIRYNNIVDNTKESMHLTETAANVNAVDNWWGTTDEATIRQTISDYNPTLRPNLGEVTFTPFLTSPAYAPAIPSVVVPAPPPTPSTTPTPTPTSQSTPDVYPTVSPSPYPTYMPDPTDPLVSPSNEPEFGGFSLSDITTAVVIVIAVGVAITIIMVLNRLQINKQQDS